MIQPPSVGPRIGATTTPMPKVAMATPRFSGGKLSSSTACEMGTSAPPPMPWKMRATMRKPRSGAMPQSTEASVNRPMQTVSSRFRPKRIPSQPVIGSTMALDTR